MTKKNAPTMKDVAREAGVALGTVSKVINGIPVSEEYRNRVLAAIETLHYEVNTYARGLKTQRTNLIALIIPNTVNPFFSAFTDYIEGALYQRGLRLLLCCADGIPEKEIDYLNLATQNKVDGIIALTYSDIGKYIADDIPMVVFDRFFENHVIPRVASDNFAGGCMAVEKLLELGCRHPVYIRFHSVFPGESDKRMDGYLYACKKYGIEPDYLNEVDCPEVLNYMQAFLENHKNPDGTLTFDGVFAHTDYHGYLFIRLLRKQGYRVPEDVQLIGFDGIRQFGGENESLFVSSMCQPIKQLAEKCVEILVSPDRSSVPSLTLLPVRYEYGGTTKKEQEKKEEPAAGNADRCNGPPGRKRGDRKEGKETAPPSAEAGACLPSGIFSAKEETQRRKEETAGTGNPAPFRDPQAGSAEDGDAPQACFLPPHRVLIPLRRSI